MASWNFLGLLKRKASAVGGFSILNPKQPVWTPRNYAAFSDEGYSKNVVAFQAINRIADAVASVELELWDGDIQIEKHTVLDLLKRPNPRQSGDEFFRAVVSYLMLSGNSYFEATAGASGFPVELWTLRPDRMKIVPGADGQIIGFEYKVGQRKFRFDVDEILGRNLVHHIKLFNPMNDWYGMSPIEAGAYGIDQHTEAMKWMQSLLQNSARPSGALTTPADSVIGEEQYNQLRSDIEEMYSGGANAGRPLLLQGGMTWEQMGLSPTDMGILESKNSSARDICLTFGVPPQLLGIPGDNTYSNYKEARLAFWEDTVIPLLNMVLEEFNHWMGPWFGPNLELRANLDDVPAIADKRSNLWEMAENSTDLTINERRAMKGYDEIEGGDMIPALKSLTATTEATGDPNAGDDVDADVDDDVDPEADEAADAEAEDEVKELLYALCYGSRRVHR